MCAQITETSLTIFNYFYSSSAQGGGGLLEPISLLQGHIVTNNDLQLLIRGQLTVSNSLHVNVDRLWTVDWKMWTEPEHAKQNMQSPFRKVPVAESKPAAFLL